ncbi:MAG: amino-acid N-acetyltransferase [Myxococcales bacterium]|nr:amino-acid N-acetyltransferase [Myxococcales bacterium]MCB9630464.1 amino-acid N-acetyltransferase [Sandaracinaceae bacterium]
MPASSDPFVQWFRSSAPYIHAHRGRTFVILFGGELLQSRGARDFIHDVALLQSLGVRVVLVAGARPQIDAALARRGTEPRYVAGMRVTDDTALACVKEAAGTIHVELEALFSTSLPNSPMAGARVRVASGNFVTARPVGVIDGVDYEHSGLVRKIDAEAIGQRLDDGAVVLLSSIGYSLTGDAFNVGTPDVASAAAVALKADKIICLIEGRPLTDGRGSPLHEITPSDAEKLVASGRRLGRDVRRHLEAAATAVRRGVRRGHLVERAADGALLRELFTRDGVGTLVTGEAFEDVRQARRADVGGIHALIEPLEERGVLIRRSREMLEDDIDHFTVIERDGMIVACAALYPYPEKKMAELACVVVAEEYRHTGRGEELLAFVEKRCRDRGLTRVFVLTTQTAHWFIERGFVPGRRSDLPALKRAKVDPGRGSKVFLKTLPRGE